MLGHFLVDPLSGGLLAEVALVNGLAATFFLALATHSIRAEYRSDVVFSDLFRLKRSAVRHLTPAIALLFFLVMLGALTTALIIFYFDGRRLGEMTDVHPAPATDQKAA